MAEPIVIVHGWSDKSGSFRKMAAFVSQRLGVAPITINLADWLSLNDEVTYRDLREAMKRAWEAKLGNTKSVNIISHSTGALVVRDWMTYAYKDPAECPVRRHVMLAPANFGSPLAHKGHSFLSRAYVGGFSNRFQTGAHILRGLEVASPYTWDLAMKDLFGKQAWYGANGVMATVLMGNRGYQGARSVVNEPGTDGTVRVSTANLNAARAIVRFGKGQVLDEFTYEEVKEEQQSAFALLDGEDHSTVAFKAAGTTAETEKFLEGALKVTPDNWTKWKAELAKHSETVRAAASNRDSHFHAFQNTVVRTTDSVGNPVKEYLVELTMHRNGRLINRIREQFQRDIIHHVHNYKSDESCRSFYLDLTLMERQISHTGDLTLMVSPNPVMTAKEPAGYGGAGKISINQKDRAALFQPDRTLLLQAEFHRELHVDNVFKIESYAP